MSRSVVVLCGIAGLSLVPADSAVGDDPPRSVMLESQADAHRHTSRLWGNSGDAWSPDSRLPDFSFAGYRRGEEPYRIPEESISVQSFGAQGDGQTDDTHALRRAIAAGEGKVIELPAGCYVLSDQLEITSSNLVLRGAGPGETVLKFTRPLEVLRPTAAMTDGGRPTSGWSWGGGLITIGGRESSNSQSEVAVTGEARRGDLVLQLASPAFQVGDEIVLTLRDDQDQSLVTYLYRGETGDITGLQNWECQQVFRVTAVDGPQIGLDRGLRFDVRRRWKPTVGRFQPAVTEVGLEGVAFQFPATAYGGHFQEVGYNPVEIGKSAAHCWLRDLLIHNADSGPYIRGTFCTVEKIRLTADETRCDRRGQTGHHGITFYGCDCLCTDFAVETPFIHDLTVQRAIGCVFSAGRAVDLSMDHHRWAPYENLYTDLDAGEGGRLFASSGGLNRGNHTAAGATFWNIRAGQPTGWPGSLGHHAINVVAVPTHDPSILEPDGRWFEAIPPGQVEPANLHRAMLEKRLGSRSQSGADQHTR